MKTKRIAYALLLSSLLVGCAPSDAELQEQGWVKDPANNGWVQNPADNGWVNNPANNGWVKDPANNGWVSNPAENGWVKDPAGNGWVKDPAGNGWVKDPANNGWVDADELTPSPTVTAGVVHWVPGAETADVTFNVNLEGATKLNVVLGGKLLTEFVDYEFDAGKLTIYGAFLADSNLGLGEHKGYVFTENGSVEIKVSIVSDPTVEGSTIPLKEIEDVNLSGFGAHTLSAPIPNTNDLLITEISTDMGNYNYIEVFNNTTSEYNLKDHRILLADPSKQVKKYSNGLLDLPLGGAGVTYIYNDYKIPALSSALIWIVNTSPWEVGSDRKLTEAANVQSLLLGEGPDNLSVAKFKSIYGLDESVLVFPSRTSYMLGRTDYGVTETNKWGTALAKSASNRWADINSKTDKRMIQIQKVDETTVFEEEGKFYVYEMDVLHKEEEIYADGKLDANDVLLNAPTAAVGNTNREFIHALFARKTYVTSKTDLTPTGEYGGMDLYNNNTASYYAMLEEAVKPVATAMVYPNIVDDPENEGAKIAAKWGATYSQFAMQFALPVEGSHMARFIPLEGTTALYTEFYKEHDYKDLYMAGLGTEVAGYGANSKVKVPESSAYPTDYLAANHNSAGRVTALMLPAATE